MESSSVEANSESESNGNSSSSPNRKGEMRETTNTNKEPEYEESDVIQKKDPKVRDLIRSKVEGSNKHYYDGLQTTQSRSIKRPLLKNINHHYRSK